jgi:hypothetical protein
MSATDPQIIQNKIYDVRSYPSDFMFELSENESNLLKNSLRSQIVTSNETAKSDLSLTHQEKISHEKILYYSFAFFA